MAKQLLLGAHCSAAGGVQNAILEGESIGATTVQLFTANQKRWKHSPLKEETIHAFKEAVAKTGLSHIMCHDSYLINLGSPKEEVLEKSRIAFREEIQRCNQLGITYCNFHPGAALKEDRTLCLDKIVESLLETEDLFENSSLRLLLETTAGQGSVVGCRFEELGYIIERVQHKIPIGVCIDTCHIFVAGYDIRTPQSWDQTLQEFDQHIGLKHLFALHLNDSTKGLASRVDRHKPLGEGEIGIEAFKFVMQDPRLLHLPKYLETPGGPPLWKEEIAQLQTFAKTGQPS